MTGPIPSVPGDEPADPPIRRPEIPPVNLPPMDEPGGSDQPAPDGEIPARG